MSEIDQIINSEILPGGSEKQMFEQVIQDNNLTCCKIQIDPGTQKGDNYVALILKITITGTNINTGNEEQLNFILKASSRNEVMRRMFIQEKLFSRETYMYQTLLPQFKEFQISHNATHFFNNYPKFYSASLTLMDEYILMENMKSSGFVMTDRMIPLDCNHCKIVLSQLGKYHSISYAMKKHQPDLFKEYSNIITNYTIEIFNDDVKRSYEKKIATAGTSLDPIKESKEHQAYQKFADEDACEFMKRIWNMDSVDDYSVIVHGDCWNNNMLYKYDNPKQPKNPTDVCFVDWQSTYYNSPVIDLSYFLYTCTDKTVLTTHFDDLIGTYYNSLTASLKEMNCDPEEMFPFRVLEEHCEKYFKYGIAIAANLLHLLTSQKDELPDFSKTTQLNKEEMAKWDYVPKNIDMYKSRMKDVIKHAVSKNFL